MNIFQPFVFLPIFSVVFFYSTGLTLAFFLPGLAGPFTSPELGSHARSVYVNTAKTKGDGSEYMLNYAQVRTKFR